MEIISTYINDWVECVVCDSRADVSHCGRWLIVTPRRDCKDNTLYFADLNELPGGKVTGKLSLTPVITKFEADYEVWI